MEHQLNIKRQKWVEHTFNFGIAVGWSMNILTRISDIGMRCQYHCEELSNDMLSTRLKQNWSIKEHIGNLIDLEELHMNRIMQFKELKKELRAADMSNQKTEIANHNNNSIEDLITKLAAERNKLISDFKSLNEESMNHSAFHPRLKEQISPVDLMFFIGEHDDHHLTSIIEIKNELIKAAN